MVSDLGRDVMSSLVRGYVPERSGEISLVPKPGNVLGQWTNGLRGADDPRTTHATPWDYHQRVPIVLYGPGFVRAGVVSERAAEVADIAPTLAELLQFPFEAPDGVVLREALLPRAERKGRPRLIVLLVQDGGGWNLLQQWPRAWPELRRLAQAGTAYTNATVGSAPPVTAPAHANMGTGAHPWRHGIPENTGRLPDGRLGELFYRTADPRLISRDTLGDAWDRAQGNLPWVGLVGFESWHLGMMSRGARADGGDRDVAILWDREEARLRTNEEVYSLPDYLPGEEALATRLEELDGADGAVDGRWEGHDLDERLVAPGTPAFVRFMGDITREILQREPVGRDRLTDLLFVEFKSTDYGAHVWNMLAPEEEHVVRAQDEIIGELVTLLDELVGPREYVLALSADHGVTPRPAQEQRIDRFRLAADIDEYFGAAIVEEVHPDDVYLDMEAVREAGIAVESVARFIADYRVRDGLPEGTDRRAISEQKLDERVFAAALPGSYLETLSGPRLSTLGPGLYAEGDLTSAPPFADLLRP